MKKTRTEYTDALIFGTIQETETYIDIDGYSNAKNIKEAYKELGEALKPYDRDEAEYIGKEVYEAHIKYGDDLTFPPHKDEGPAQFILEYEEVTMATNTVKCEEYQENHIFGNKHKNRRLKGYELENDVEYAAAKWYLHVRIPK